MARRRRCPDSVVHHSDQGRTMRRTSSRNVAARRGSSRRRVQWASAAATRWPRASSPPSNATSSTAASSLSGPRSAWRASGTSKGGTTRTIAIPAAYAGLGCRSLSPECAHRPASRRAADKRLGFQALDHPRQREIPQRSCSLCQSWDRFRRARPEVGTSHWFASFSGAVRIARFALESIGYDGRQDDSADSGPGTGGGVRECSARQFPLPRASRGR